MRVFGLLVGILVVTAACMTSGSAVDQSATPPSTRDATDETSVSTQGSGVSTSTTPEDESTTSTSVPAQRPVEGWVSTGADPSVFGAVRITDAAVVDGRIVAVGCATTAAAEGELPIWTSLDAASWDRAAGVKEEPFSAYCLEDVAATPIGVFAVGSTLLRSSDGRVWDPVEFPAEHAIGYAAALFATAERVTVLVQQAAEAESTIATLLTTTDGTTWMEGPAESAALFDSSAVGDVLVGGEGLIAVGASPGGEFVPTAAVWTSPDGLRWRLVTPRDREFSDAYMNAIMDTGNGYLAVGGSPFDTGLMAAWTSPDGTTWSRLPETDEQTDPSVAHMEASALTEIEGTLYAAGRDFDARRSGGLEDVAALWASSDGITWERVDLESLPGLIPFNIVNLRGNLVGFWPPPWPTQEPVQVFITED